MSKPESGPGVPPGSDPAGVGRATGAEPASTRPTSGGRVLATFAQNRLALVGVGLVVLVVAFCYLGPVFYHTNQVKVRLDLASLPPGGKYPLGTDPSGYNVLGRLMEGGRSSLEVGLSVTVITTVIGTLYGAIAGYVGGILDAVMMRIIDTFMAVPTLVLLLVLVNLFTPDLLLIIILLSVLSWLPVARLVRAEVLSLRTREFVQAVKVMGGTRRRIVLRHLIPNAIGVIIVNATFSIADAILMLSTLGFLGLGLPPPQTDWGGMLSGGLNYLFDGYWWLVYPAAIILILTVVAFNLIGDGIRDSFDGRLQRR